MLLADAHAFGPQCVGHAVVDLDQPVDLGLAGRPEARRVIALLEQLGALADQRVRAEQPIDQPRADQGRDDQSRLDGDQPPHDIAGESPGQPARHGVQHEEVGVEEAPKRHVGVSVRRRCRISPGDDTARRG